MSAKKVIAATLSVGGAVALAATQALAGSAPAAHGPSAAKAIHFTMVRSTAVVGANCLKKAQVNVTVTPTGQVEVMQLKASHLPPNREFDLFVTQAPDTPFGDSWYQGDLESDGAGNGSGRYVGRFSSETFIVAPDTTAAPVVHRNGAFPDANSNPKSAPVHTFHLGLWFGSPRAAAAAGCPTTVTPFNGDHTAGIQALSTREFPALAGPLRKIKP
jgi:hypothetical protein